MYCLVFVFFIQAWAEHRGKFKPGDKIEAATWKTRLRCALNKLPDIKELKEQSYLEGNEPFRVYKLLPEPEKGMQPRDNKAFLLLLWGSFLLSNFVIFRIAMIKISYVVQCPRTKWPDKRNFTLLLTCFTFLEYTG